MRLNAIYGYYKATNGSTKSFFELLISNAILTPVEKTEKKENKEKQIQNFGGTDVEVNVVDVTTNQKVKTFSTSKSMNAINALTDAVYTKEEVVELFSSELVKTYISEQ